MPHFCSGPNCLINPLGSLCLDQTPQLLPLARREGPARGEWGTIIKQRQSGALTWLLKLSVFGLLFFKGLELFDILIANLINNQQEVPKPRTKPKGSPSQNRDWAHWGGISGPAEWSEIVCSWSFIWEGGRSESEKTPCPPPPPRLPRTTKATEAKSTGRW